MDFRTELEPTAPSGKVGLSTPVLALGSCFAQVIGKKLREFKIPSLCNPFGVIYNPLSINRLISHSLSGQPLPDDSWDELDQVHFNYHLHSSLSNLNRQQLESSVSALLAEVREFLDTCQWLIVSWGTAWVYHHRDSGQMVANCHKVPAREFDKKLLTTGDITTEFSQLNQQLTQQNPDLQIALTVSPVRHLRDTLELNQVSKSTLRLAAYHLTQEHKNIHYFPSYELLLDDLRDYRFYGPDLIHPSPVAQEYIWNKFIRAYGDPQALEFVELWSKLRRSLEHRPFHPKSEKHQAFLRNTLKTLEHLDFPVDLSDEISKVKKELI